MKWSARRNLAEYDAGDFETGTTALVCGLMPFPLTSAIDWGEASLLVVDELGSCCRQRERTQVERMEFGPAAGIRKWKTYYYEAGEAGGVSLTATVVVMMTGIIRSIDR